MSQMMWKVHTDLVSHVCTVVSRASAHSRPGKRPCTSFQGVNVAASIQTYGNYVPGKHPCGPKSRCMFKRPWALTRDTAVYSSCRYCTVVYCNTTVMLLYKSILVSTIVLAQNLNPILCLTIMTT